MMPELSSSPSSESGGLGLWSGVGLCVASMVGSGIFLSSGFMAQEMSAGPILLAWALGAGLALLGALAYAELARQLPRSGGEYRYLREFLHPAVAYVAGWVTLIIGFAQPAAINALAAVTFAETLVPLGHAKLWAAGALILMSLGHGIGSRSSAWLQNLLALVKATLLVGFVALGLIKGNHSWPSWEPPSAGTSTAAFVGSLFYISYAFSGWNTSAYAAERFARPERDVGRAMVIGCLGVAAFYMLTNWIFVANLDASEAAVVLDGGQAALGHAVTEKLAGSQGATFMSILAVLAFLSAMSAMLMIGPHIASTMARDGALPAVFAADDDSVPKFGLAFQLAVALLVLLLHDLQEALESVGATLMLFSGLSSASLVVAHVRGRLAKPAAPSRLLAAALYAGFSVWLLYYGFRDQASLLPWLGGVAGVALLAYYTTARRS